VDPVSLAGIGIALGGLLLTMLLEGSSPLAILLLPPLLLVLGGTLGAAIAGATSGDLRRLRHWTRLALAPERVPGMSERIELLVELAGRARREGLLALDRRLGDVADPFLREGLRMAVDGTDPELLRTTLENRIAAVGEDEKVAARFFARMGGYAPTIGIIGTVIGLIHVLGRLDRTEELGGLIAAAFVATLWGVLTANVLWLPMSSRILRTSALRAGQLELLLTGIAEIQAGTTPRAMRERLVSLLPPAEAAAARDAA
jgi:chemotaxis protein MotA